MRMTDDELVAAIEAEQRLALDDSSGTLQKERTDALDRYRGVLFGNEIDGRSQVVDKTVLDTIEWIMPSLIRVYLGGDEIGKFDPRGPEDEQAAQAETDVCNWYLEAKNDTFSQINATLRDALLLKNGYMVGFWQSKYDTMTETYEGLHDEEIALLMQDQEITVTEHTEKPDPYAADAQGMSLQMGGMLHDVKVERKTCEEFVQVESIPPDELLVSKRHRWTSLIDADFVQWKRRVSIGQLRAEGFKVPDEIGPDDDQFTQEWNARQRFDENSLYGDQDVTTDPSRRVVTFRDSYIRIDLNDKGMQQLWRVCTIGRKIILKEEADIVPFAAFSPIIFPHSHIGSSVYDLINDIGIIKTTLQRQLLDNVYLQNAGRMAVSDNVNLDDLLVSRPGGIVRMLDGARPGDGIMPLVTPDVSQPILQALEYMDGVNERRTGVARNATVLDTNAINNVTNGVFQGVQSAATQRIELIARTFAGGFKDLFLIIHALALKHSTKQVQMKLKGKWVTANPREWTRRTDFSISVGLGSGTPESQMQKLMALAPMMAQAGQLGLAGPTEFYNFGKELWKSAGYKMSERFLHQPQIDPKTGQPMLPPPKPDPHVQVAQVKAQSDMQLGQMKGQQDMQHKQMEMQVEQQTQAARTQADVVIKQHDAETNARLDQFKTEQQLKLEAVKHSREQDTAKAVALINAVAKLETAKITAGTGSGEGIIEQMVSVLGMDSHAVDSRYDELRTELGGHLQAIHQAIAKPKRTPKTIVRDGQGKAVGIHDGEGVKAIVRDPTTGRAVGVQ